MNAGKAPAPKVSSDGYPGLDAILKKARKIKPFSTSDKEQRLRALYELVPTGVLPAGVRDMVERMEKDYAQAVAAWRADNWLLPPEKESEFPYSRTKNIGDAGDPLVKYGAKWLPKDGDSGTQLDSEGESISFSKYMDNILRAAIIETSDLRIKGVPTVPDTETGEDFKRVLENMRSENAAIKTMFDRFQFDRYEEVRRSYSTSGYTITNRFRAFKLFSREQQRLLDAYLADPKPESKKALLAHANTHGELVRDLPKQDPPAPKPKAEPTRTGLSRRAKKKLQTKGVEL